MDILHIETRSRSEFVDITRRVSEWLGSSGLEHGAVCLFVPHTTAAVTINEGADPDVRQDMLSYLSKLVPCDRSFHHSEGNSDAHIKSSLLGSSIVIPVEKGSLCLGRWQSIYFCEFDGPRTRSLYIQPLFTQ